jgi:hypothetical protein
MIRLSRADYAIFYSVFAFSVLLIFISGCSQPVPVSEITETTEEINVPGTVETVTQPPGLGTVSNEFADVLSVEVNGAENAYRFAVEISSPDTGCDQYADWWEVLSEDGTLLYRRILAHSHRDEQPFVRSGGPINLDKSTVVFIRAHMHPNGYGGISLRGSVVDDFTPYNITPEFAAHVESEPPLPEGCAF